jgi:ATP-dependent RNA helicase RhlE
LIAQGSVDVRFVKTLVLDEADHMLDLGFIDDIKSIKRKLNHTHQTLFFSATINPTIKKLAYSQIKSQALRIQVSPEKMVSKNITHYITKVEMDDKRHVLLNFMRSNPKAKIIVFVRTQVRAERVLAHLKKNEVPVVAIHGGMVQEEREENLEWFRNQPAGALIATDVTARGIDLSSISHVINYDIPDEPENYVHRVGRTGRGFAKGEAVSFCSSEEIEKLEAIESFLETEIPVLDLDPEMLEVEAPPDVDNLKISDILAMEEARYSKPKKSDKHKAEKSKSGSPKKKKR